MSSFELGTIATRHGIRYHVIGISVSGGVVVISEANRATRRFDFEVFEPQELTVVEPEVEPQPEPEPVVDLASARRAAGLTQAQLARLANISLPYMRFLEQRRRRPSPDVRRALGRVLGGVAL